MSIIHVNETYAGLPNSGRLSGTNGDLVGIMDIALLTNGWAIEYTSGNARVYRPGTGNRFRLHMNDDSATSGDARNVVVRGCENASGATTLTDPFPTVALVGNTTAVWAKSSVVSTAARAFDIYVSPTWVLYCVNLAGTTNIWECHFFGDCPPAYPGDSYNTTCYVRQTANATLVAFFTAATSSFNGISKFWWCRSYDGTVKSTMGGINFLTGALGTVSGTAAAFQGPSTGIDTMKLSLLDAGATISTPTPSTALAIRAYLPNILAPIHNNRQLTTPNTRDTYVNTAYNPSFVGTVFTAANTQTNFLVVEGSDTWTPPSG